MHMEKKRRDVITASGSSRDGAKIMKKAVTTKAITDSNMAFSPFVLKDSSIE